MLHRHAHSPAPLYRRGENRDGVVNQNRTESDT